MVFLSSPIQSVAVIGSGVMGAGPSLTANAEASIVYTQRIFRSVKSTQRAVVRLSLQQCDEALVP